MSCGNFNNIFLVWFFARKVSSVLGGGSGYGSTGSYGVTDSYKYRKQGSFEQTNKSLDDQLKELDSQLLSKVGKMKRSVSRAFFLSDD